MITNEVRLTNKEFIEKCKEVLKYKTLYVLGGWGGPLTEENKKRYLKTSYNAKPERAEKINACNKDTFGFDCVCFIKSIIWGWKHDMNDRNGGAIYESNGLKDLTIEEIYQKCTEVGNIDTLPELEGVLLFMDGHIGVYIGNGEVIECTPIWHDGVQISKLENRKWKHWGKAFFIDYAGDEGLYLHLQKEGLRIRQSLSFKNDKPNGVVLYTVPKGKDIKILEFMNGIQRDGWQWCLCKYNSYVGYCQLDSKLSYIYRK